MHISADKNVLKV